MDLEKDGQTAVESEGTQIDQNVSQEVEQAGNQAEAPSDVKEQYVPNYKFKVMEEEKEFDEFLRGAVKDKKHEDALRDLYTKAYGLEAHKKTHETLKERVEKHYRPLEEDYKKTSQNLNALGQILKKKDYQAFFDTLQIPREDILKYALEVVKFDELPPEQKQAIQRQREVEQYNAMLVQQHEQAQHQAQNYAVQVRTMELNNELMRPEVSQAVQAYDAKAGKPGAFRDLVINHANMKFYQSQVDLPVNQAVQEVMALYGNMVAPQSLQNSNAKTVVKPPVIPNIQGSGNSPAKKMFKSLDEIRAHAKTLE